MFVVGTGTINCLCEKMDGFLESLTPIENLVYAENDKLLEFSIRNI